MKSRIVRALIVVATLMVPAGALVGSGAGPAGAATTTPSVNAGIQGLGTVTCPVEAWATLATTKHCRADGLLLAKLSNFTQATVVTHHRLVDPDIYVTIPFIGHCEVTIDSTVPLDVTPGPPPVYTATFTLAAATTPTHDEYAWSVTGTCGTLANGDAISITIYN